MIRSRKSTPNTMVKKRSKQTNNDLQNIISASTKAIYYLYIYFNHANSHSGKKSSLIKLRLNMHVTNCLYIVRMLYKQTVNNATFNNMSVISWRSGISLCFAMFKCIPKLYIWFLSELLVHSLKMLFHIHLFQFDPHTLCL